MRETCPRCAGEGVLVEHGGDIFWRDAPKIECPRCGGIGEVAR